MVPGRRGVMRFGVYLPTFAWADLTFEQAARVKIFARKAEDLGFDALWVAEHFLVAPGLYSTVWMSPLLCLAHAASVTRHIRLATGLLILPYYHPVTLAREIQTLHHLSNGRFVLGVGPGWDEHEFESLGMRLAERGRRTDEIRQRPGPLLPLRARLHRPAPRFSRAVGGRWIEDRDRAVA
ncbi:MAG: LLM class flavin-dependent oxidoreductase [Chloroflexi bacterium]|nr:MAG: LLM class flavin-dependent oxidoreductase [Chloroflexota bacterium]